MSLLAWRYQRFHISYALGFFAMGLLVGIALSQVWAVSFGAVTAVSLIFSIMAGCISRRWYALMIITLSSVVLGVSHGTRTLAELDHYGRYIGQGIKVQGVVLDDPEISSRHTQSFSLGSVAIGNENLKGSIYVTASDDTPVHRGDAILINGILQAPFGHYQGSLRRAEVIHISASSDPLLKLRDSFGEIVRTYVAEPAASLGLGFVIGQRSSLPSELDDQLRIVGLTHIVVASGYNLTILVRLSRRLFEKHSRYGAFMVSSALTLVFIIVSGASPSMVRAGMVTGLSLLAWYYGRRFHPLLLILYVAALTAYMNPIYEWYDIGWYLSFLAFAGVLMIAPLIAKQVIRNKAESSSFLQVIIETVSAQIMTIPLILMVFGTFPTLAILSNMLVAPVIPLAMLLTTLVGVIGVVSSPLAELVGVMTTVIIDYVLAVVSFLAAPDWAQLQLSISPWTMVLCFGAIISLAMFAYRRLRFDYRQSSIVE